jgi:TolB protein
MPTLSFQLRAFRLFLFGAVVLGGATGQAASQEDWFRTGTGLGVEKLKLGLASFAARTAEVENLAGVFNVTLWNDLQVSGVVELLSPSFFPLQTPTVPEELNAAAWADPPAAAHMVAYGHLTREEKQLVVAAWLSDVRRAPAPHVIARRYRGDLTEDQARELAHQFADEIVMRISGGLAGIAQTKIVFASNRTGSKEIWLMDYDGHNPRQLTRCGFRCLTPRWSPDRSRIAYTAYLMNSPSAPRVEIRVHSLVMNRPVAFPSFGGTTTTPAWSPDGTQLAFSSSRSGDPEIYLAASDGSGLRRLTHSSGVDISPAWNPRTGTQLAFVSDRGGSPQIYLMDADGSNLQRLTSGEGHAVSPAWSPNGQMIAFAWQRQENAFDIYVLDVATRQAVQFTRNAGRNEQPSWAPDGRHLVFQSNRSGRDQIWMVLADGTGLRQLTFEGSNTAPQWSPR